MIVDTLCWVPFSLHDSVILRPEGLLDISSDLTLELVLGDVNNRVLFISFFFNKRFWSFSTSSESSLAVKKVLRFKFYQQCKTTKAKKFQIMYIWVHITKKWLVQSNALTRNWLQREGTTSSQQNECSVTQSCYESR